MPEINITVKNKIATQDKTVYVCGNSDYVANFDFDSEWDKYEIKTARFAYNGKIIDIVFDGTQCPVPIISNAYFFYLGVFAGDLHTTTPARVPCTKSILCGSGWPAVPPDDVYNQIMEKLNSLEGGVTDEQLATAVEAYMAENPVDVPEGTGLTDEEKALILTLFRNAAYTSADMGDTLTQLETLWNSGEDPHTHSYTSSVTTAATCTTDGVRTYTCECGESYTEKIPATGHNYVGGVCSVCGAATPDTGADVEIFEPESNTVVTANFDVARTIVTDGVASTNASWVATDYMEIPSGHEYVAWTTENAASYRCAFYDSEKTFLRNVKLVNVAKLEVDVIPENAAIMRLSSNTTGIGSVDLSFGNNLVRSWGTTKDNHMNTDGTITEGYTGSVQQYISNGYIKIPENAQMLIWGNNDGFTYRHVAISVYDSEYNFVYYQNHDSISPLAQSSLNATMDLTTLENAAYIKVAAWDNNVETNNNPAEQVIVGCI